jgi:opacity protein-like surface antigen
MKRLCILSLTLAATVCAADAAAQQQPYRQKKYFGPIPLNGLSINVGFIDGPDHQYLTDHLIDWAAQRGGSESWEDWETSFYSRVQYQRQITPNHMIMGSVNFSYLSASGAGDYFTQTDPVVYLLSERTLTTYLLSFDAGFLYYMIKPEVQQIAPYVGGGFSAFIPIEQLETTLRTESGEIYDNPGESVSESSLEVGLHGEFGLVYYISNRYAAGLEGRYQKSQSKFTIHEGNFDIDYSGLTLSLVLQYFF